MVHTGRLTFSVIEEILKDRTVNNLLGIDILILWIRISCYISMIWDIGLLYISLTCKNSDSRKAHIGRILRYVRRAFPSRSDKTHFSTENCERLFSLNPYFIYSDYLILQRLGDIHSVYTINHLTINCELVWLTLVDNLQGLQLRIIKDVKS